MAEEEILQQQEELHPEDQNLLEEVQKLKENSVPKAEYDRVLERNKELTRNWMQNQQAAAKQEDPDTIESLRAELYSDNRKEMTNLDSVKKILKLRDKIIDSGGKDPFLSTDANSEEEISTAERVAAGLQSMVDEADGNATYFNAMMKQVDATMPGRRINTRR